MLRSIFAAASLLALAACETTGAGGGAPLADPSPEAGLAESVTEPTDGADNELAPE